MRANAVKEWLSLAQTHQLPASRKLKDRTVVFHKDDPAEHMYLLSSGTVELFQRTDEGLSVLVKILVAPTLFGIIEALNHERLYLEEVRAAGTATIHACPMATFRSIVSTNARASYECLVDLGRAFAVAARLEAFRVMDVEAALANALSAYADVFGEPLPSGGTCIRLRRAQNDFAAAVGSSERSVNRILVDWKNQGLIRKNQARYVIPDLAAIQRLAGSSETTLVHRGSLG